MTEKDWKLLLTLHEESTITKAAEKMYISQPALTYRIRQIEQSFNTKIIFRGNKGVVFTKEGEYLVEYARNMIKELEKTKDNLNNMKDTVQGILRIGVSSTFALYKLPLLLKGFITKYPNVEIKLTTGWSYEILKLLQSEEIHVAIIRGKHNWHGEKTLINKETICIASKEKVDLTELPHLNLINYDTDIHLKNVFNDWWKETYSTPPKVAMEVDRIETCKELVKIGLGYAIVPSICLNESDQLNQIDIKINGEKLIRETWLLHRKELNGLQIIDAFNSYVRGYYRI